MNSTVAKAIAAAFTATFTSGIAVAQDGHISLVDGFVMAAAFFGSFGVVWITPNTKPVVNPPVVTKP